MEVLSALIFIKEFVFMRGSAIIENGLDLMSNYNKMEKITFNF